MTLVIYLTEFSQEISNASEKRFKLTQQSDPVEFMSWFLNTLHKDLGGTRKRTSSKFKYTIRCR